MGQFDHFRVQMPDGSYKLVKDLPWHRKDRFGWPIETYKGKPFKSFVRLVVLNIKKVLHI